MKKKKNGRDEASALSTITGGASLFFIGQFFSNIFGLAFNLILTRGLGAMQYGIYTYAKTLAVFFVTFAQLGTGKSLLRFIPAVDDPEQRNIVAGLAYLTTLFGSTVVGTILFLFAPKISFFTLNEPLLTNTIRVLAIALPFNTALNLTNSIFRASENLQYQVFVSDFLKNIIRVLLVGSAVYFGFSLVGIVVAITIGLILSTGVGISLLYSKTDIWPSVGNPTNGFYSFYSYSVPLTLKDLGQKMYTRSDILMVGFFLSGPAVGIYRVSILLSAFLKLPLSAVNQLFPPIASGLNAENEREELSSVYETVTRWVFTVSLLPSLVMIVYSQEILAVFGSEFTGGAAVLVLFAIAKLTSSVVGPSGFLLMMTDHQYLNFANQLTLGILNIILNYLFIQQFGFVGAAVATAGTLAAINLLRVGQVWYTERMTPYSSKFLKPLFAGVCAAVTMLGCTTIADGYLLLAFGSIVGLIVFGSTLVALGIEREDREFYTENVSPRLPK
mgnify:CR=1 FL=1